QQRGNSQKQCGEPPDSTIDLLHRGPRRPIGGLRRGRCDGNSSRFAGPALGPPGGKRSYLVFDARGDALSCLACRAVPVRGGLSPFLEDTPGTAPPQATDSLHSPRWFSPFALPRARLRVGGPVHVAAAPAPI